MRPDNPGQPVPFVRRVVIRNYRSIAECDVTLGPLTVLLGFNAAGKSNFLDALQFVADALADSPVRAVDKRGGLESLLHRGPQGLAPSFGISLDLAMRLPGQTSERFARYGFTVSPEPTGTGPFLISDEALAVEDQDGVVQSLLDQLSKGGGSNPERAGTLRLPVLALLNGAAAELLTSDLGGMRFYDLRTDVLRALDESTKAEPYLGSAGEHLGRVLGALTVDESGKERLDGYLASLVPGARAIEERREGRYSTVQARFAAPGGTEQVFLRESLSEGTLRAAGVLAALFQPPVSAGSIPLVAIEEPETALHPANVGALYEALDDASLNAQVIVTSQSSDLLDSEYVRPEHIRVVANIDGATRIGEVDAAGRSILEKQLMTISELHRSGQMQPALDDSSPGAER